MTEGPTPQELALVRKEEDFDAEPVPIELSDPRAKKSKPNYLPDSHRLLPQSPDAERGVLCSLLLAPMEVGGLLAEKHIRGAHFFIPAHQIIFDTLMELWERLLPIDFITLTEVLRDRKLLDQVGGAAFVTDLFIFLPTSANAAYYIEILQEKYTLREIIIVCTQYAARCYDEQDDVNALLDGVEKSVMAIRSKDAGSEIVPPKRATAEAIIEIQEIYDRGGSVSGMATGFPRLDRMIDGFLPADMIVIAALSSGGKTAIALNIAEHIVDVQKKSVGVFSLEMSYRQLWMRLITGKARVNMARVRDGGLSERDFPALARATTELSESKLWIDDSSELTISDIRARARRMKQTYKIEALFIDYIQLVGSTKKRRESNREQEVAEISGGAKAMAKELGIPVIVLAQLNKEGATLRPKISALRESQRIGMDADKVLFVVRPEMLVDNDQEAEELEGVADVVVAKNRNGPTGIIPLTFLKAFARFENRATEGQEEPTTSTAELPL